MLRLLMTGLVAIGLHAGIGKAAFEVAGALEDPIWLRTRLVDKELLKQIRERIAELEKEKEKEKEKSAAPDEIAVDLETLDEAIAALPDEASGTLDLALGFAPPPPAVAPAIAEPVPELEAPGVPAVPVLTAAEPVAMTDTRAAELASALAELDRTAIAGLSRRGAATDSVLSSGDDVPAGLLDAGAGGPDGVPGVKRLGALRGGAGGEVMPGMAGGGKLTDLAGAPDGVTTAKRQRGKLKAIRTDVSGIAKATVTRKFRKKRNAFRRCYEQALARDPELSGNVRLRFEVQPDGSVQVDEREAAVLAELSDPSVASCALGVLAGMRIAAPENGPAEGTVTLVFAVD